MLYILIKKKKLTSIKENHDLTILFGERRKFQELAVSRIITRPSVEN